MIDYDRVGEVVGMLVRLASQECDGLHWDINVNRDTARLGVVNLTVRTRRKWQGQHLSFRLQETVIKHRPSNEEAIRKALRREVSALHDKMAAPELWPEQHPAAAAALRDKPFGEKHKQPRCGFCARVLSPEGACPGTHCTGSP